MLIILDTLGTNRIKVNVSIQNNYNVHIPDTLQGDHSSLLAQSNSQKLQWNSQPLRTLGVADLELKNGVQ